MDIIPKKNYDDIVFEQLLSYIKDATWPSGTKIPTEPELCSMFGVSRITVRSAIQRLKSIGLLDAKQGKGTFVTSPLDALSFSDFTSVLDLTEKEFLDMTALRSAIEPISIRLIVSQGANADILAIESAYWGLKKALKENDYEEYTRQDYQFHVSIILASGNKFFSQIINIFKEDFFKYFKELNKFMFNQTPDGKKMMERSVGPNDSHTLVYNYLKGTITMSPEDLINLFNSGNKENFAKYLKELGMKHSIAE